MRKPSAAGVEAIVALIYYYATRALGTSRTRLGSSGITARLR
jgi:hypothetical protein